MTKDKQKKTVLFNLRPTKEDLIKSILIYVVYIYSKLKVVQCRSNGSGFNVCNTRLLTAFSTSKSPGR